MRKQKVSIIVPTIYESIYSKFVESFNSTRMTFFNEVELYPVTGKGSYGFKCNKGAEETDSDILIFSNDDVMFTDYWDGYLSFLTINPNIGAVQPSGAFIDPRKYGLEKVKEFPFKWAVETFSKMNAQSFSGYHFAMRREVFRGFNPQLFYYEDYDLFLRLESIGMYLLRSHIHHILHYGMKSSKKNLKEIRNQIKDSYKIFKSNWPSKEAPSPESIIKSIENS